MKKIIIIITTIILTSLLLTSIFFMIWPTLGLLDYSKAGKRSFNNAKNFLYKVSFEGIIIEKKIQGKIQDVDDYRVDISLISIDPIPGFGHAYFFSFNRRNEILSLRLTQHIFENININDTVIKSHKDYYIKFNGEPFQLLSTKKDEWFPNVRSKYPYRN